MNFIFRCMPAKQIGLLLLILTGWATLGGAGEPPQGVAPSERWSGDLPVARLELLPEGQRLTRNGYIGDEATFAAVWQAMKPGETVPPVDFAHNLVVFSRNVDFYNRIDILRVALSRGVAEILAMETMSAMPIEDRVAMAVVPRAGIEFVLAGDARIRVIHHR